MADKIQIGEFRVELFTGRSRYGSTRVSARCDAIAIANDVILFASLTGPESSVKSIRACLQSEPEVGRTKFTVNFQKENANGEYLYNSRLRACDQKYRCTAHQILPGLWHLVVVAKLPGFLPVLDDESLWQELQSERFTTPIIRQWLPYIKERMAELGMLIELKQVGCHAGLVKGTAEQLDEIVTAGLSRGHIEVPGDGHAQTAWPTTLDDYMLRYGGMLGQQAERSLEPLHVPGRDKPAIPTLLRQPFESQAHVIAATAKALKRQKSVMIIGEMGVGKAQPLDAKVLTPTGFKAMGDIRVGDKVINPKGGVATVRGVFPQGEKDVFRVTFSDGSSTECCDDHLWSVRSPIDRWRLRPFKVKPLKELRDNLNLTGTHSGGNKNRRHYIPMVQRVDFKIPYHWLPLDPYLVGALIGDGCLTAHPSFSTADAFMVDELSELLPENIIMRKKPGAEYDYNFTCINGQNNVLTNRLRNLGLFGHSSHSKRIPKVYLHGDFQQRVAMLQGLFDTDGHCTRGFGVEFITVSSGLADDVRFLVQSLGGTVTMKTKTPTYTYKGEKKVGQLAYRLYIRLPRGITPFRLPRKADSYRGAWKYGPSRAIVAVEPIGKKTCQCIALDSENQLYVTDDFIVTHNTIQGMAAIHAHADGKPYHALVFCPGQLTNKWQREILETIPGAVVYQIETWTDLLKIDRAAKPTQPTWYVVARDRAKLGARWQPAFRTERRPNQDGLMQEYVACPSCGGYVTDDEGEMMKPGTLTANRGRCEHVRRRDFEIAKGCGAALWQMNGELWRYEPALYIKRRLWRFFDYLVIDEAHEEKSSTSAQGNAAGSLASACKKVIALTGTLIGGYAEHVRPLLFRLSPQSLVNEGLVWDNSMPFSERYGRIDTTIVEKSGGRDRDGDDNRESRGSSGKTVRKSVRPGIMPALYGRHLIDKAVFLSLSEVADNLPELQEECVPVAMDDEQSAAYEEVEKDLVDAMKEMLVRGDKRLLGTMLQTLLAYPDYPFEWGPIGYVGEDGWVTVTEPPTLDRESIRPKEQALIDLCQREKADGRQTWVFVQFTDKHDVQSRLERILKGAGLRVGTLRSSVSLAKREEWIAKNGPKVDVVISHPKLVETGLDLFDKGGRHNFATLVFYETGYNLFTLRQASRRSWRIGQQKLCKVVYLFYAGTMQARAMSLMGKKLAASQALEGKFSTEGLVAMGGEEGSIEMALARSLVSGMDDGDVRRAWGKVGAAPAANNFRDAPKVSEPATITEPEKPDDDPPPLGGADLLALMKANRTTIKGLAARLGVTEYRVQRARKIGVGGADRQRWVDAIMGLAALPAKRGRTKGRVAA